MRAIRLVTIAVAGLAGCLLGADTADDPLAKAGIHVTTGAAPGYVPDRVCAGCHREIATSFQHVGMSQSFYRPRDDNAIETFGGKPYFHEKSQQYLEIVRREGRLVFRRWQVAADGKPINELEEPVDWILGSGHHARTYIYRQPVGELYQLPLAWYSQTKSWGMAPGYDRRDHEGVTRRVRHECLFCHNAYPEIEADRNTYWRKQTFPAELPEGVGCQRCHGAGASHVRAVMTAKINEIHSSTLDPSRLESPRRNDVCYECHMQPTVVMPGLRRYGRDIYSYRPGTPLADYLVQLDITENAMPHADRFEINHHPYRLEQSRCFRESDSRSNGKLSCLTCHDPHRKVSEAERPEHYRKVCLGCHPDVKHEPALDANADCTTCHMPKRRTQDVVHVVMTDHLIRRKPGGPELVAPLEEREPAPTNIEIRDDLPPATRDLMRAAAVVRATGGANTGAVRALQQAIAQAQPAESEPYLDLAMGLLRQKDDEGLEKTAASLVARDPKNTQALEWLGLARYHLGRDDEGIAAIEKATELDPTHPEAQYNLGLLLASSGREGEAIAHFERATQLRPNFVLAWFHLGEAYAAAKRLDDAITAYKNALAIDPTHTRSYASLGNTLIVAGQREEAIRYWRHGAKYAVQPDVIRKLIEGNAAATP
jgi:predicted CXXCH cytochrome family protein